MNHFRLTDKEVEAIVEALHIAVRMYGASVNEMEKAAKELQHPDLFKVMESTKERMEELKRIRDRMKSERRRRR